MRKTKASHKTITKVTKRVSAAVIIAAGVMVTISAISLLVVQGFLAVLFFSKQPVFQIAIVGELGVLSHPYLLFKPDELEKMRQDANTPGTERNKMFAFLKSEVDKYGSCTANSLSGFGLVYQIIKKSDLTYANKLAESCKKAMLGMVEADEWEAGGRRDRRMAQEILQFALGYDLFYEYLKSDNANLVKIRNKLAFETNKMWEALTQDGESAWRNWWNDAYSQNHYHRNISSLLLGSLALKYEGSLLTNGFKQINIDAWISDAKLGARKVMTILEGIKDGSWYEGTLYMETTQSDDLPLFLHVLRTVEGIDYFQNEWFKNIPKFYLYNAVLNKPRQRVLTFGDGALGWSRTNAYLNTLRLIASEFHDGVAQFAADQIVKQYGYNIKGFSSGTYSFYVTLAFIFYNSEVKAQSPAGYLHPSWHASDLEAVFLRSSWDPNNHLIGALKSGPHGGHRIFEHARDNEFPEDHDLSLDHADQDANGFSIFYNNEWLANEIPGYDESRGIDSEILIRHNTIDVDQKGQIRSTDHDGTATEQKDFWNSGAAGVSEYSQSKNIDYVVSSVAKMYPSSLKLTAFDRHFIFIKPRFFIIIDNLKSSIPHTYDWYLNVPNDLTADGNWLKSRGTANHILGTYLLSPKSPEITLNTFTCDIATDECKSLFTITGRNTGTMPYVKVRQSNVANTRFAGVMYPFNTQTAYVSLRPTIQKVSEDENFMALEVEESDGTKTDIGVTYGALGSYAVGQYQYNGRMAAIQKKSGVLKNIFLSHGNYLKDGDKMLVSNLSSDSVFEAEFNGAKVTVSGKNFSSFRLWAPGITQLDFYQVDESNVIQMQNNVSFQREGEYIIYDKNVEKFFLRGDSDLNQNINLTDAIHILNFLFRDGPQPQCYDAADANDNGFVNLTDAVFLLDFLFRGGLEPPAPGTDTPGLDPTEDNLGCKGMMLALALGEPYVSNTVTLQDCMYIQQFDRDFGTSLLKQVPACVNLLSPQPTPSYSPTPIYYGY